MNYFFGKKPKEPEVSPEQTVDDIENIISTLEYRQSKELEQAKLYEAKAKQLAKTDQKGGLIHLRKRNTHLKNADNYERQIHRQREILDTIHTAAANADLIQTTKASSVALGALVAKSKSYDVDAIADELDEHMVEAAEINDALSRPFAVQDDGGDVEDELRAEMREWGTNPASATPAAERPGLRAPTEPEDSIHLPDIPDKSQKNAVRLPI
jgi:type II secretory pathway component HofQ